MRFPGWLRYLAMVSLALATILCVGVFADDSSDRTEVGRHISIAPDQRVGEVTCFGCSVRVRGHITSDLTLFGGSVILEDRAQVDGDLTTFGGTVRLDSGAKVGGDVVVLGGRFHRAPGSSILGDVVDLDGLSWLALLVSIPLAIFGTFVTLVALLIRVLIRQVKRPTVPAIA